MTRAITLSVPPVLLVLVGGAAGAALRYLTDVTVTAWVSRRAGAFPWGTVTVNVLGSLLLGLTAGAVSAAAGADWVLTLVGTGFCGALTTFSTFGFETVRLVEQGRVGTAALNCGVSLGIGMLALLGGWELAAALV